MTMEKWDMAKTSVAIAGSCASFLYGGWTQLLNVLLAFVVIDYFTGLAAARKEGNLDSSVGWWGIAKKVCTFGIVAVAHLVDTALGDAHLMRDAAIFFFISNELLSLLENSGRLGVPIPPFFQKAIAVLKDKGGVQK